MHTVKAYLEGKMDTTKTTPNEKTLRDSWETPPDFWEWIDGQFHFDLDVCASPNNKKCPRAIYENSLDKSWGRFTPGDAEDWSVWCNPGFSRVSPWLEKAYQETQAHPSMTAVVLTHAGLGTRWFEKYESLCSELWLLNPRIQFIAPEGIKQTSNPRDSILWVFRPLGDENEIQHIQLKQWK
jgi:phage N-6-adenine-methyltransferase